MSSPVPFEPVAADDFWSPLRRLTPSRIGLGRSGDGVRTSDVLQFQAAHARARDAVQVPLNVSAVLDELRELGLGEPVTVASRAKDRAEYLRRPDLGRQPANLDAVPTGQFDVGFVLADGLSTRAVANHGVALVRALMDVFDGRYSFAPPVVATQARVAIGDPIGARLGVQTVLVLVGERPGLSVSDSLGVYLTHQPRVGRTDAERNCVSNIHPHGLSYPQAAGIVAALVAGARQLGESGVRLKDDSRTPNSFQPAPAEVAQPGRRSEVDESSNESAASEG
jgi:ethanolamine ammonia-lyase small subunit